MSNSHSPQKRANVFSNECCFVEDDHITRIDWSSLKLEQVDVAGARATDVVGVSNEHTGMNMLSWTAHIAMDGQAMVAIHNNEPEVKVDLDEGRLTLIVSSFAGPQ